MNKEESLNELLEVSKAMSKGDFSRELRTEVGGRLCTLAKYIDKTRRNLHGAAPFLSAKNPSDVSSASSQLNLLTQTIDDVAQKLLGLTEEVAGHKEKMACLIENLKSEMGETSDLPLSIKGILQEMEAINMASGDDILEMIASLSFQDYAGQRIRKVVATLEEVEKRLLEVILIFGVEMVGDKEERIKKREEMMEQLKDNSEPLEMKQDLVDDIFEELGL